VEIRDLVEKMDAQNSPEDTFPKDAMWAHLLVDYTPSNHPSHIAYAPPNPLALPPAITAVLKTQNQLMVSTMFQLTVTHCFDADYSEHFHPTAGDYTICPCEDRPHRQLRPTYRVCFQHMHKHIILCYGLTAEYCTEYLSNF